VDDQLQSKPLEQVASNKQAPKKRLYVQPVWYHRADVGASPQAAT
jgi:hypothetical protein